MRSASGCGTWVHRNFTADPARRTPPGPCKCCAVSFGCEGVHGWALVTHVLRRQTSFRIFILRVIVRLGE